MATRRENGAGTKPKLNEKTGLWEIRLSYTDKLGNRKIKAIYAKTQTDCKDKREKFLDDLKAGIDVDANKMTFGQWLEKWLDVYKKPQLEVTSYDNYNHHITSHIIPLLGNVKLISLQRVKIQEFFNKKQDEGLSVATLKLMKQIIGESLRMAAADNIIIKSPAVGIKLPSLKNIKKIQPLSQEEIKNLLTVAKDSVIYSLIFLAINTGMRRGELAGLRWQDIDFKHGTIHIQQGAKPDRAQKKAILGSLKTNTSCRIIPIAQNVINELKRHKTDQAKEKLELGEAYNNQDLVFARPNGDIISMSNLYYRFTTLAKKAGINDITLHDLRHTFASIAISRKCNIKALSAYMGHSNISITLDRYGHLMPGDKEEIVNIVGAYIAGN